MEVLGTNDEITRRKTVLKEIQEMGISPFGEKFLRTGLVEDYLGDKYEEHKEVTIAGRVTAYRGHGKTIFIDLKDLSGKLQLYFKKNVLTDEKFLLLQKIDIGDIIGVKGKIFKTKTGEVTVYVEDFSLLSKSLRPLPEKWHGLKDIETRYRQRYVDLIVNDEVKEVFVCRTKIIAAIRNLLDGKGFLEVETPMMQQIAGGAQAKPFITHHEALNLDLYLRIAPELFLKRLIVGGLEKVYEINKNFRNEGISRRHNPEFTMLEVYAAFADYNDMMDLAEQIVNYIVEHVSEVKNLLATKVEIDFSFPWKRQSIWDAVKEHTEKEIFKEMSLEAIGKIAQELAIDLESGMSKESILVEIFEKCVESKLINPTFITDYPSSLCPLAKAKQNEPETAERFELFINGQEIANAYSELNDPLIQGSNFEKQVLDNKADTHEKEVDYDYIRALEYGMPPAGGLGIGIDRLVMVLTGAESIRDVILFPQLKKEIKVN